MLSILFSMVLFIGLGWGESSIFLIVSFFLLLKLNPIFGSLSFFFLEIDWVSWNLILLSVWVILLSIFSSTKTFEFNNLNHLFLSCMLVLNIFLVVTFMSANFMMFYVMFECCLIPILYMILGWGYQPERCQAGMYMFFYTLFGSLPLFFVILFLNEILGGMCMSSDMVSIEDGIIFLFLIVGFLVKFPMYSVHLWLLKAHVEAPVAGSMILAGVLLKLGGYGLIRFSFLFEMGFLFGKVFIMMLSLWGGLLLSCSCLRVMDMKLLIAASSVVHMSTCICGIFVMNEWGVKGCVIMMVAHGLCSSGLFCLSNLIYERTSSRSMSINKGLLSVTPVISLWWFLLLVCNMAGPPSFNLAGEIMLLICVINWSNFMIVLLIFLSFLSAAYSLYLYSLSQHGMFVKLKGSFSSGSLLEYLILVLHWGPLNGLILMINEIM